MAIELVVGLYILARVAVLALGTLTLQRNRELAMIFAVVAGLGSAWASHYVGISPALGAFIAGMLLGSSAAWIQRGTGRRDTGRSPGACTPVRLIGGFDFAEKMLHEAPDARKDHMLRKHNRTYGHNQQTCIRQQWKNLTEHERKTGDHHGHTPHRDSDFAS